VTYTIQSPMGGLCVVGFIKLKIKIMYQDYALIGLIGLIALMVIMNGWLGYRDMKLAEYANKVVEDVKEKRWQMDN